RRRAGRACRSRGAAGLGRRPGARGGGAGGGRRRRGQSRGRRREGQGRAGQAEPRAHGDPGADLWRRRQEHHRDRSARRERRAADDHRADPGRLRGRQLQGRAAAQDAAGPERGADERPLRGRREVPRNRCGPGRRHRRGVRHHPGPERHRQLDQDRAATAGADRARSEGARSASAAGRPFHERRRRHRQLARWERAMAVAQTAAAGRPAAQPATMQGGALWFAAFLLAVGNFMVVLDMTIANVSVPTIAGGLAVAPNEGTWVITSYSVAEAIMVPLTGWLAARFGALRVFVLGILGFGVCSALCGIAPSLGFLILFRIMQGLCGGPIMPMSQTLMMRVFPPAQRSQAMGLWSMTTVVAPIIGPILGGWLCDNAGWPWVFYINVPIAAVCGFFAWRTLAAHETPTEPRKVDFAGLALLILFVGALQIMLDKGKELDWFGSPVIVGLAIVAAVGFAAFLIWELTEPQPIVDLRVFRHRGFTGAVATIAITFGTFFASIVIVPLWLQTNMGYTAT